MLDKNYFKADSRVNKIMILNEIDSDNKSVRSISRSIGLSVGSVSQYIRDLTNEGILDPNYEFTPKGRKYYEENLNSLQEFLLRVSDLVVEEFGLSAITVAAVACNSSFTIGCIEQILQRKVEYQFFSTAYEAFSSCRDAHFFIIGSVPAAKLMSFGIHIKLLSSLASENHSIVGKEKSDTLIVIGEDSVSASLVKNARLFNVNLGYKKFEFTDSIKSAIDSLANSFDVLLWEPFSDYAVRELGASERYRFPTHNYATQVLVRNEEQYVENRVSEAFQLEVREMLQTFNTEQLIDSARKFLGGDIHD